MVVMYDDQHGKEKRIMEITRYDDIIDSRDVIARISELEGELQDADGCTCDTPRTEGQEHEDYCELTDAMDELKALKALEEEASSSPDWRYGEALIRDSYFEQYAEQLAEDLGALPRDAGWPANHIDWKEAADELKIDYFSVTFAGEEYWIRG